MNSSEIDKIETFAVERLQKLAEGQGSAVAGYSTIQHQVDACRELLFHCQCVRADIGERAASG